MRPEVGTAHSGVGEGGELLHPTSLEAAGRGAEVPPRGQPGENQNQSLEAPDGDLRLLSAADSGWIGGPRMVDPAHALAGRERR